MVVIVKHKPTIRIPYRTLGVMHLARETDSAFLKKASGRLTPD